MRYSRRTLLATTAAGLAWGAAPDARSVPILYTTGLYHPHEDPDDHFDLATLFALPEFDIRGIVLDDGARQKKQPGEIALRQMMRLTGRQVPYSTGLGAPLGSPEDDGAGQPEWQHGVTMILDVLRRSPGPVTIFTTGSLRDVAAAFNRDPELFRAKTARLFLNIGDSAGVREYNVRLDVHAWTGIMRSGLPIYWCPCHEGGALNRGRGYATWWQFRQHELLADLPPPLRNYFVYALKREQGDPLAFLDQILSRDEVHRAFHLPSQFSRSRQRNMWCTGPLLYAAGRRDPAAFDFIPARVEVEDNGAAALSFEKTGPGSDMFVFKLAELRRYDQAMAEALAELLTPPPRRVPKQRLEPAMEWRRSRPDRVLYLPKGGAASDEDNEVVCVFPAPRSDSLLALWTQSSVEGHGNNRLMISRSHDGAVWTPPVRIAGTAPGTREPQASWGIPIVNKRGRIYCIYLREMPRSDVNRQESGAMGCASSDDDGRTWTTGDPITLPRNELDHPDPAVAVNWWTWAYGARDRRGRYVLGYTRITSPTVRPRVSNKWMHQDTRCAFMRFENLDDNPAPADLRISWLPAAGLGLDVPDPLYPGRSVAQEPGVVLLPDGRLLSVMRTMTGTIYYSVSSDEGDTWRKPEPLLYRDGGVPVLQPVAPCPIFPLAGGRFLLLFHNNDGCRGWYSQWKKEWKENEANHLRNPAWLALGEFRPDAHQPIWFGAPQKLLDTDGVIVGPKRSAEIATYASLTEWKGVRTLWYPDRKYYLLGKYITDEWLADMGPASGP